MPTYKLSRAAENDIAAIAEYTIEAFGIEQAIAYRDGLIETLEFLAEFPKAARERKELERASRTHPYRSHLIFYRIDGDGIFIQGVRHAPRAGRLDQRSQRRAIDAALSHGCHAPGLMDFPAEFRQYWEEIRKTYAF